MSSRVFGVSCVSDGANWLGSFCHPVRSWNGLLLRRPIDMEKRDLIQKGEASLLELRSYLFSRQCTLLIFLQRPWEVTSRALELLHNCVQELRLLEVCVDVMMFVCKSVQRFEVCVARVWCHRCLWFVVRWTAGCFSAVWRFFTGSRAVVIAVNWRPISRTPWACGLTPLRRYKHADVYITAEQHQSGL